MSLLEIRGLERRFGGLRALRRFDLDVRPGESVGIIGPNGAGKTTLFALVGGSLVPTAGTIRFRGERIDGRPPHEVCRRGIARTYQLVRPFYRLTVRENVLVGARFGRHGRRRDAATARREVDAILERAGLAELAERRADELPLALRKSLELARAVATGAELLLLDEVAAGLRAAELDRLLDWVAELRSEGRTILYIEHVMHAIRRTCERVVVLHHGEKIAEAAPDAVARDPRVIEAYLGPGHAPAE